jgi:hypothetical protein
MASQSISDSNFGIFIAYVLPGYTALKGLPFLGSPVTWNSAISGTEATIAGFLSGSVEAIFAGLSVSLLRWLVLDSLHHRTGLPPPRWDFAALERTAPAFEFLVQSHYRYYKFYANMVVALFWAFATIRPMTGWNAVGYFLLTALFFYGSRDALKKYYDRAGRLLGDPVPPR